jgi:hypothetical protein
MAGRVAQVIEHLTSRGETLSSNPSTGKKKKILTVFWGSKVEEKR